jgi:hypothetical protein
MPHTPENIITFAVPCIFEEFIIQCTLESDKKTWVWEIKFSVNANIGSISKQDPRREMHNIVRFIYYELFKILPIRVILTEMLQRSQSLWTPFALLQNARDTQFANTTFCNQLRVLSWGTPC